MLREKDDNNIIKYLAFLGPQVMSTRPGGLGCISMGMAAIIRDFPSKHLQQEGAPGPGKTTKTKSPNTLELLRHGSRHGKPAGKPAIKTIPNGGLGMM